MTNICDQNILKFFPGKIGSLISLINIRDPELEEVHGIVINITSSEIRIFWWLNAKLFAYNFYTVKSWLEDGPLILKIEIE